MYLDRSLYLSNLMEGYYRRGYDVLFSDPNSTVLEIRKGILAKVLSTSDPHDSEVLVSYYINGKTVTNYIRKEFLRPINNDTIL